MHLKPYPITLDSLIIYVYLFESYVGVDDVIYTLYNNFYVKLKKKQKQLRAVNPSNLV